MLKKSIVREMEKVKLMYEGYLREERKKKREKSQSQGKKVGVFDKTRRPLEKTL